MPIYLTPGTQDLATAGPVAVAVDALRTLISNMPFFQSWTGTANAGDALTRIFSGEVGYPAVSLTIAGGVATLTTREPVEGAMQIGDVVELAGASIGAQTGLELAGSQTLTAVGANSISFSTALANQGPIYPDDVLIVPQVRPLAVISETDDGVHSESVGTGGASILAGSIDVLLEADVSTAYWNDARNALYEARNSFGSFIQGLMATQGTLDLMCLNRCEPVRGPEFTSRTEQNDSTIRFERWRAVLKVTWGMEG